MSQIQLGSMQVEFKVEVRRCCLNDEIEAQRTIAGAGTLGFAHY
jgi:hypothetical protein